MTRLSFFLLAAAAFATESVLAHFSLTYPPTRGFSEDIEANAPCGGFNTPLATRSQFPLKNGFVEINAEHPVYSYQVNILVSDAPTETAFTNASTVNVASGNNNFPLQACFPVNLSQVPNAKNGTNATLQVIFNGGDGLLYQCTDIVLVDNAPSFNSSICTNANGTPGFPAQSPAAASSKAPGSNNNSSGVSLSAASSVIFGAALFMTCLLSI
ncbi:hypothetical protein BDF14DRAFT_1724581 [Spinellus fusiger]|nr:hypothetical protein BDF14DRAFT_1724581 [Spinellus fusiger]